MGTLEINEEMVRAMGRYVVVSAYLARAPKRGTKRVILDELAKRQWQRTDGSSFTANGETIRSWVRRYRRFGLEGLKDKARPKRGMKRLSAEQCQILCDLKKEVPARSLDRIIKIAEATQDFPKELLTRSTVHRVLQSNGLSQRILKTPDKHDLDRFEADYPNDLWQSDMLQGPWLPDPDRPGKMRVTKLYAFMDDHSRLLLHGRFHFSDKLPYLELVFRRALQKWGVPRRVYYDNGQVYRSHHMQAITAHLGIYRISFTQPRRPEGHGKIEALNRLMTSAFIAEVKASTITTLDELNEAFNAWVAEEYNPRIHSEIKQTPLQRWQQTAQPQFIDDERLRQAFLWKEKRTCDKTGLFSLLGTKYQAPAGFGRREIEVRFDPEALHQVEIWNKGAFVERVSPFSVTTHRRAKQEAPQELPSALKTKSNWLGHLVKNHKPADQPEPSLQELLHSEEQKQTEYRESLIDFLAGYLTAESLDLQAIREHIDTHGPIDIERSEPILQGMIETLGNDKHVSVYLEALRHLS